MSIEDSVSAAIASMESAARQMDADARLIKRMRVALEEIEDYAQDQYDGPEDRHNSFYLRIAQEGLGRTP